MKKTLNIAHRGASALYTENTLKSFEKALDIGCDGIELDVHLTRDGELIIFHDRDLTRMTEGRRTDLIGDLTLSEIRDISLTGEERIPTLEEFMVYLRDRGIKPELQIEIKKQLDDRNIVGPLLATLRHYDYLEDIYISSFHPPYLGEIRSIDASMRTILLSRESEDYPSVEKVLRDTSATGVHFLIQEVSADCVDHFKSLGYLVGAWKLKADTAMMKKAVDLKLFRATCDHPGLFSEVIG